MASKRHKRRRSCEETLQYPARGDAMYALARLRAQSKSGLACYKCHFANHWHIGHRFPQHFRFDD